MIRILKITTCLLLLFFLCGCFDYNELNMQALVSGAGIDEEDGFVRVDVLCASTGEEKDSARYTSSGESFFDAVRAIGSYADKKLYWGHTRCLIIGEQAVGRINEVLDVILRSQDVYLDIAPVIAKGTTAVAVLDSESPAGKNTADSIADMFANEANSRRFSALRVWEILREREKSGAYILPSVSVRDGEPYMSGGAVVQGDKIETYLSGEQILFLSLMTAEGAGGYLPPVSISKERSASFEILRNRIRKRNTKDRLIIEQECVLSPAEVRGDVSDREMEDAAQKYLHKGFSELVSFIKKKKLETLFGAEQKNVEVVCRVRVSNILGGKR